MNKFKITFLIIIATCLTVFGQDEHSGYVYTLTCQIVNEEKAPLPHAYIVHGGNDGKSQTYYANEKGEFSYSMHTKKDGAIVYCEGYIPQYLTGKIKDNEQILLEKLTGESILSRLVVERNKNNNEKIGLFYNKGIQEHLKTKGEALLSYTINKEGKIQDIKVSGSNKKITEEAREAMKHFPKLEPNLLYGKPVNIRIENDRIFFPAN